MINSFPRLTNTDQGKPRKCAQKTIEFLITDQNDHSPYFTNCPAETLRISEDADPSTFLTTVRANDNDRINGYDSPFGDVVYQTESNMISIGKDGRIFLNQRLDRELQSSYRWVIYARDKGTPPKESLCVIKVIVTDINDSFPDLNKTKKSVRISSELEKGETVAHINATDADEGINAELTFSLLNDFGLFEIFGSKIVAKRDFSNIPDSVQLKKSYNLTVNVEDGGGNRVQKTIQISVLPPDALRNELIFNGANNKGSYIQGSSGTVTRLPGYHGNRPATRKNFFGNCW